MTNYTYKKRDKQKIVTRIRYGGLTVFLIGLASFLYFAFPLLSWKLYFEPAFAANSVETPVPKTAVLSSASIKSLLAAAVESTTVDFTDAQNWFPEYHPSKKKERPYVTTYNISVPKLAIKYANISTVSTDLSRQLVHYPGTPIPPENGNAVIFGHSTLPQLFNPSDYRTIFARAHTLDTGDMITITVNGKEYWYTIHSITVTTPSDTTIFSQSLDDSYITLVTCTPPGTTWQRLIIRAKPETDPINIANYRQKFVE